MFSDPVVQEKTTTISHQIVEAEKQIPFFLEDLESNP